MQVSRRGNFSVPQALRHPRRSPLGLVTPASRIEEEKDRNYSRVVLQGPIATLADSIDRIVSSGGDHVYVEEIQGSDLIHLRFGDRGNSPIRLMSRMVLKRKFSRLIVTFLKPKFVASNNTHSPPTRLSLILSWGPFAVEIPEKSYGLQRGAPSQNGALATTVPRAVWIDYLTNMSPASPTLRDYLIGADGGTLLLKNTDPTNTLLFGWGQVGEVHLSGLDSFPLSPGETMTIELDHEMRSRYNDSGGAPIDELPTVFTASGTCLYSWLLSALPLTTDALQNSNPTGA